MHTKTLITSMATAIVLAGALMMPATASAHGPGKDRHHSPGHQVVYVKPQHRHHHRHRVIQERYYAPIRGRYYVPAGVYRELPRWRHGGSEVSIIDRGIRD
jgi:hypothetical protein